MVTMMGMMTMTMTKIMMRLDELLSPVARCHLRAIAQSSGKAGGGCRVIFPGRRGRGPGPDFRGAVIAGPSAIPVRGDVELHVRASDFRGHGHHRDPAYQNIVLHVVFHDDEPAASGATPLPGGGAAPVVALAPWVARRSDELQSWLARPLLWREPCHEESRDDLVQS